MCTRVRLAMDAGAVAPAEIYDDGYVVDEDVRQTLEVEVEETLLASVDRAIADIRPTLERHFNMWLAGAEGASFLRYQTGGFYRRHQDCLRVGGTVNARQLSIVVFITGNCAGGVLRIYGPSADDAARPRDVTPAAGTLVAFPSHFAHEVLPVTEGVRDVVVDWFY
jgi:predicted 2-oxoglutarate/Fe(II)-dependent dioxygenase YbiX